MNIPEFKLGDRVVINSTQQAGIVAGYCWMGAAPLSPDAYLCYAVEHAGEDGETRVDLYGPLGIEVAK